MATETSARINLSGAMDLIKKSKYPLAPIYEAVTNSLEAISLKQNDRSAGGEIKIVFYFTGLIDEVQELDRIDVIDNGIGLDKENFERFETLLDKSKGYNNRGSGRLQYLHRFDGIRVESTYQEDSGTFTRRFNCDDRKFITNHTIEDAKQGAGTGTKISMVGCALSADEKVFFDDLKIEDIKKDLKKKFLLRFHLEKEKEGFSLPKINIVFIKNNKETDVESIKPEEIPAPQSTGEIKVSYLKIKDPKSDDVEWEVVPNKAETLQWAHFKLPEAELDENGVFLCSKDVPVEELRFKQVKKGDSINGYRYITGIHGDILDHDEYVSHSVDSFTFPNQKETEKSAKEDLFFNPEQEFLFFDSIHNEINKVIPQIYGEIFNLQEQQEKNVAAIAKAHGIPIEVALSANISLTDNEQKITDKIYKKQAEQLSRENQKIKKLYESLNELNPTADDYQEELERRTHELLKMIPLQNKEELSRYVIRREMVTHILKLILENNLQQQIDWEKQKSDGKKVRKDKEGLIHDLIFKRKTDNGSLNDLWIFNEEFVHFDGCSELPINQIEISKGQKLLRNVEEDEIVQKFGIKRTSRRPDIFLYPDEGKCILIEFKEPEVDLTEHLHQMQRYCKLIANCSTQKFERFYCYLIGEKVDDVDMPDDYKETAFGDFVKPYSPINSVEDGKKGITIASSHTEVVKLSDIHIRASRRNKSFANKLGI